MHFRWLFRKHWKKIVHLLLLFSEVDYNLLAWDQLKLFHRGQMWFGMGFANQLSKPNSVSLWGTRRGRCRCERNLISLRTSWGFFLQGGIRGQPPAWHSVCGCSLTGICVWQTWIMGALRAQCAGCQHNRCPCFTFEAAAGQNAALVTNIEPSV